MNTCLQNIVSVRDLCPGTTPEKSTSGYDIWQAPELKYTGLAAMTDAKYVRGRNLLLATRDAAIREVESDFLKMVTMAGYGINTLESYYQTGIFKTGDINSPAAISRGITLHSAKPSLLRKLKIKEVQIYPLESATAELKLWDNGNEIAYDIELIGGQINTFPLEYVAQGNYVRIYLDNTNKSTYSSYLTCYTGCDGKAPNDCGYVRGWNGTGEVKREGFGINATFSCECDYSSLLCSWSKQFIGEIVYNKMRSLIQEERLNSDRLNNFTIYNREQAEKSQVKLENEYRKSWNDFAEMVPQLLKGVKDSCLDCSRPKWVTNV